MSLTVSIEPGPVDWEKGAGQDSRRGPQRAQEGQRRAGGCGAGAESGAASKLRAAPGVVGGAARPTPTASRSAPAAAREGRRVAVLRGSRGRGVRAASAQPDQVVLRFRRALFCLVICHVFDSMLRFSVFFFFNRYHCFPRMRGERRAFINFAATHLPAFTFAYVNLAWFYCII